MIPTRAWRVVFLLCGATAACALAPASDRQGQDQPSDAASRPAASSAPALTKIETIQRSLQLAEPQADAHRVARTRRGQIDDPVAFTMFLRKTASLPKLQSEEWSLLDRPAARSLLADPERYAGRPIALRVYVNRVWKWEPGQDFTASADWTRADGPVYRYDCLNAEAAHPADEPIYVVSTLEPNALLGPPRKIGDDGDWRYTDLPRVQLAGVFYKVYAGRDTQGLPREYPVVFAWQMRTGAGGGADVASDSWARGLAGEGAMTFSLAMGAVLLLAIAAYVFWRLRQATRALRDRPLRTLSPAVGARTREGSDEEEDQADAGLSAAAEEFRRRDSDRRQ